jgi:hypothetical protein
MPATSFMMRDNMRRNTSGGKTYLWSLERSAMDELCSAETYGQVDAPVCSHEVLGLHRAQRDDLPQCSAVSDADGPDGEEHGERLAVYIFMTLT